MQERLKEPADQGAEELADRIRESASQIWLAGLGAFTKAQKEGTKIFEALVQEGEAIQARTRKIAGDRLAEFTTHASGTLDKTWDRLEQVFEDRVARALHSLNVPTKKDIDTLNRRVAELTAVAAKITAATGKKGHAASRAKKPKARKSR